MPEDLQAQGPGTSEARRGGEPSFQRQPHGYQRPGGGVRTDPPRQRPVSVQTPVTPAQLAHRAERLLLLLVMQNPGVLRRIEGELGAVPFEDPLHQQIFLAVRPVCLEPDPFAGGSIVTRVLDRLSDPDARLLLTEMVAKPVPSSDSEKEAADCIEKIRKHRDSRRRDELFNQIKAAEAARQKVDPAIVLEYMELVKRDKPSKS